MNILQRLWQRRPRIGLGMVIVLIILLILPLLPFKQWLVTLSPQPLRVEYISGEPLFTRLEDIQEELQKMPVQSFFEQDMQALADQVRNKKWIKDVVVRKTWPNKLYFWVRDYHPVATFVSNDDPNNIQFLSKTGVIFPLPSNKIAKESLPHFQGDEDKIPLLLTTWQKMNKQLATVQLQLDKLTLSNTGAWQLRLKNQMIVKLGQKDWQGRLIRFIRAYPQINVPENQHISYIDLRYPQGLAVKFLPNIPTYTPR